MIAKLRVYITQYHDNSQWPSCVKEWDIQNALQKHCRENTNVNKVTETLAEQLQ